MPRADKWSQLLAQLREWADEAHSRKVCAGEKCTGCGSLAALVNDSKREAYEHVLRLMAVLDGEQ